MVEALRETNDWLCVISSDQDNEGVDINDECRTMMDGGGRRFFKYDVSTENCYTWITVAGALEEGSKVFVLHMGRGDPPFPECSSMTCVYPVPQELSYKEHVKKTFEGMVSSFESV